MKQSKAQLKAELNKILKQRKKYMDERPKKLDNYDKRIGKVLKKLKSKGGKK